MFYNLVQTNDNLREEFEMRQKDAKDAGGSSVARKKIDEMLAKIESEDLLNRIYRFIKYIYIHRT